MIGSSGTCKYNSLLNLAKLLYGGSQLLMNHEGPEVRSYDNNDKKQVK